MFTTEKIPLVAKKKEASFVQGERAGQGTKPKAVGRGVSRRVAVLVL